MNFGLSWVGFKLVYWSGVYLITKKGGEKLIKGTLWINRVLLVVSPVILIGFVYIVEE
jgi:hypothetical protein